MTTRRFVLHLIVGLLTFLIGVVAAVALGGFNPLESFNGSYHRSSYTIPTQSLSDDSTMTEHYHGCSHARPRTADLRYRLDSSEQKALDEQRQLAPVEPVVPLSDEDATPPPPPSSPRAPRPRH
jgi:hypothetical protein